MIDLEAIAFTTAILALAVVSREFSCRRVTIGMGCTVGFGLVLKWSVLFCCALPLGWLVVLAVRRAEKGEQRRRVLNNLLTAAVAAGVVAWPWYLLNIRFLTSHFFSYTQGLGAVEGDPGLWTLNGWTFYLRALLSYHLFLIFFLLFAASLVFFFRRKARLRGWGFLLVWLGGVYGIFTLFANKAPRHIAPLLPAVALILAAWVFHHDGIRRRLLILVCVGTGAFQWWMVTFGVPVLPERLILLSKQEPAYQERVIVFRGNIPGPEKVKTWPDGWYAYTQTAFGFWGSPTRENWPIEAILHYASRAAARGASPKSTEGVSDRIRFAPNPPPPWQTREEAGKPAARLCLGLVPDSARFNVWTFRERAVALDIRSALIWRVAGLDDAAGSNLDHYQYVLVKSGNQGAWWGTMENARVCTFLAFHPERFVARRSWRLPDGSRCWLYENAAFRDQGFNPGME